MLAKLIGFGASRDEARTQLAQALDDTVLLGFASNKSFLAACLRNLRFADGQATTAFVDEEGAALLTAVDDTAPALLSAALYAWRSTSRSPLAARYEVPLRLELDGIVHAITLKPLVDKGFMAMHAGKAHECAFSGKVGNTIFIESGAGVDAIRFAFTESRDPVVGEAQWRGHRFVLRDLTLAPARSEADAGGDAVVKAPMAGRVVAVRAKAGDAVVKGTPLLVLEAMKMEHAVVARGPGTVGAVLVEAGAQVALGQLLARIDA